MPWTEGGAKPLSQPGCPTSIVNHLFMREKETQRHRQREKQAPHTQRKVETQGEGEAPCREPDVGLDPGSPGSCPGLKQH